MLARIAAEEYVRAFWWFVIIPPLFGIVCMFSGYQLLFAIGTLGVLWPLTIPARAVLTSWKTGTFFQSPITVRLEGRTLYFFGVNDKGMKLSLERVRKIEDRNGFIILIYGIGEFVAIPRDIAPPMDELLEIAEF